MGKTSDCAKVAGRCLAQYGVGGSNLYLLGRKTSYYFVIS